MELFHFLILGLLTYGHIKLLFDGYSVQHPKEERGVTPLYMDGKFVRFIQ